MSNKKIKIDSQVVPTKVTFHCNIKNDYELKIREEMLDSGEKSDIEFVVGEDDGDKRKFAAHSFWLRTGSKKFEDILDENKGKKVIRLVDVSPVDFDVLLRTIYTHCFDIESIRSAKSLAALFEEYGLQSAAEKCYEYMKAKENLSEDTSISVYETTEDTPENVEISQECLFIFRTKTKHVLASEGFHRAKIETVCKIFELPELAIRSELELLAALDSYAQINNALPGHNVEGNHDRFYKLVRPALLLIRFHTVNPCELVINPAAKSLLSTEEYLGVLANTLIPHNSQIPYPKDFSGSIIHRAMLSPLINESRYTFDTSGICCKSNQSFAREQTVMWNVTDLARRINPTPTQTIELDDDEPMGNSTLCKAIPGDENSWKETPLSSKSSNSNKTGGSNAPKKGVLASHEKNSPKGNSFAVQAAQKKTISVDDELWE